MLTFAKITTYPYGYKINISIVFITQSYFKVPRVVRLNATHSFIMKIPNKREVQQIASNQSSDIDPKDFMKIFRKYTAEPYSFLYIIYNNIIYNITITIEDQIKDEKLQYDINREAAKISALSSGKIDKYEYLTGEEILPSNQQQIIEQAKFTYSPLGKAFEKQTKAIEDQGEKQIKAIQDNKEQSVNINNGDDDYKNKLLPSKERETFKDIHDKRLDKIEELNNKIDYNNLKYVFVSDGREFDFYSLKDPLVFLNDIKKGKISLKNIQQEYIRHLSIIGRGNKNANKRKP